MKNKEPWEDEFDEKFPWMSNLKVTHYYEEDYKKAKLLEELVNNSNRDIKSFIKDLLQQEKEKMNSKMDVLIGLGSKTIQFYYEKGIRTSEVVPTGDLKNIITSLNTQ